MSINGQKVVVSFNTKRCRSVSGREIPLLRMHHPDEGINKRGGLGRKEDKPLKTEGPPSRETTRVGTVVFKYHQTKLRS